MVREILNTKRVREKSGNFMTFALTVAGLFVQFMIENADFFLLASRFPILLKKNLLDQKFVLQSF